MSAVFIRERSPLRIEPAGRAVAHQLARPPTMFLAAPSLRHRPAPTGLGGVEERRASIAPAQTAAFPAWRSARSPCETDLPPRRADRPAPTARSRKARR